MDEVKDIQVRNLLKFLDTEVQTDPFGENRAGERAYRRAERLVAALFLLTNHIGSGETLRNDVRISGVALLGCVLAMRDEMRTNRGQKVAQFRSAVRATISQVRMLVFAGFVSPQNAEAVAAGLDELGTFVSLSQRSAISESMHILKDELSDVREYYKGHMRDIKDRVVIKDKKVIKDTKETMPTAPALSIVPMTSRGSRVLDVLRVGGELGIRDISGQLPEYGEKTIQRELGALIKAGSVRRTGLKRWSRYSIAL